MPDYSVILRSCPEDGRPQVAAFLGKAFSLKDATCASIAQSVPIVLLSGLSDDEAAACSLALAGLVRLGAEVEFATAAAEDLPKIDWPRRPQVFKRELAEHVADLQMPVAGTTLLALLAGRLNGTAPRIDSPQPVQPPPPARTPPAQEFRGIQLPEITPFSTPVLPATATPAAGNPQLPDGGEALSRLNELFPDEGGFAPSNQDITSILNRLLPDEHPPAQPAPGETSRGSTSKMLPVGQAAAGPVGHAVFLAKIADDARRQKAVPLIAELARISAEEADALSRKVIIPVMKGATREEAEAAKQKFAKIGIIARVKAPDQG